MILTGDVGGTKTVLALCDVLEPGRAGGIRMLRQQRFVAAEMGSLDDALDQFLRARDVEALTGACFGVAGPVVEGMAKITNLSWVIDARSLSKRLGGIDVTLLNDLQATALGSLVVPPDKLAVLQAGEVQESSVTAALATAQSKAPLPRRAKTPTVPPPPPPRPTIAVLALGTGLGEAMLIWEGTRYRALPSEGGHADFAPTTDEEIELLKFLRGRHGGHVSYERVLSGDGISELYAFLRSRSNDKEPVWLAQAIASGDPNAAIAAAGLPEAEHTDPVCVRTLELFGEILGAEAGNIALRGLATGGVVIGGGIPHKILPVLERTVIKRFNDKGRFADWTKTLSVKVLLEPRAPLLGAAHYVTTR